MDGLGERGGGKEVGGKGRWGGGAEGKGKDEEELG